MKFSSVSDLSHVIQQFQDLNEKHQYPKNKLKKNPWSYKWGDPKRGGFAFQ